MWTDVGIVFWRHYKAYRGAMWNQTAVFVIIAILGGLVAPAMLLAGGGSQLPSFSHYIDFTIFFVCHFYSGIVSGTSFHAERQHSTLQQVLASALRPHCLFIGIWSWMMSTTALLLLVMTIFSRLTVLLWEAAAWPSSNDFWFSVGMILFTLCSCSWVIAANSVTSLVVRDLKTAHMLGSLLGLVPFLVVLGCLRFFGLQFGVGVLALAGGFCLILAVASFVVAIRAFRSEFVRI